MTTPKDKLKDKETMTAGVTPSKLKEGMTIDLHGHPVKVTSTDAEDTLVQYANLARRGFDTHALNGFLELGTFPVGTAFERPNERAVIEAVSGDCCYQVRITAGTDQPHHHTFTYTDFIAWHMDNSTKPTTSIIDDEDEHPFESDLQKRVEELTKENFTLKQNIATQKQMHDLIVAGYEEDIERLEKKAAILHPDPAHKDVYTLVQLLSFPEKRREADSELTARLNDGWTVLHMVVNTTLYQVEAQEVHTRIVTLVRDLPAAPAPKVAVTDAAIYSTSTGRPSPIPMPANQVIVGLGSSQPTGRMLTNNVSRTHGDTKRIPNTYAERSAEPTAAASLPSRKQREEDTVTLQDIVARHRAKVESILSQPSRPFGQPSQE